MDFSDFLDTLSDAISGGSVHADFESITDYFNGLGVDLSQFSLEEIKDALEAALSDDSSLMDHHGSGSAISFEGLGAGDRAHQEFNQILGKHNIEIPYSKTPDLHNGSISASQRSDLENFVRDQYSHGKISADEESKLMEKLGTMYRGY